MTMKLKGCPHCGGDIWLDEPELHVFEEVCLQCSRRRSLGNAPVPTVTQDINRYQDGSEIFNSRARSRFYDEQRGKMERDYVLMPRKKFYRKWGLDRTRWWKLRGRWAMVTA